MIEAVNTWSNTGSCIKKKEKSHTSLALIILAASVTGEKSGIDQRKMKITQRACALWVDRLKKTDFGMQASHLKEIFADQLSSLDLFYTPLVFHVWHCIVKSLYLPCDLLRAKKKSLSDTVTSNQHLWMSFFIVEWKSYIKLNRISSTRQKSASHHHLIWQQQQKKTEYSTAANWICLILPTTPQVWLLTRDCLLWDVAGHF